MEHNPERVAVENRDCDRERRNYGDAHGRQLYASSFFQVRSRKNVSYEEDWWNLIPVRV
jgi:hypothetical protein